MVYDVASGARRICFLGATDGGGIGPVVLRAGGDSWLKPGIVDAQTTIPVAIHAIGRFGLIRSPS